VNSVRCHTRPKTANRWRMALLAACVTSSLPVCAQSPSTRPSQGELLYSTHCVGCHTTQVHWREKKLANNWTSLKAQVSRWQANSGLGWRDAEIVEVARYLNDLYYHFPQTSDQLSFGGTLDFLHRALER